jgi:hypothetical protein
MLRLNATPSVYGSRVILEPQIRLLRDLLGLSPERVVSIRRGHALDRNPTAVCLWIPLLSVMGGWNLETAARSLATVTVLVDRHACQLPDKGFGHAAHLGVIRRHSGQRTAVAPDHEGPVTLFEFRQTAQIVEHSRGGLEPCAYAIRRPTDLNSASDSSDSSCSARTSKSRSRTAS